MAFFYPTVIALSVPCEWVFQTSTRTVFKFPFFVCGVGVALWIKPTVSCMLGHYFLH